MTKKNDRVLGQSLDGMQTDQTAEYSTLRIWVKIETQPAWRRRAQKRKHDKLMVAVARPRCNDTANVMQGGCKAGQMPKNG
jgi:hypothetical protein